MSTNLLVAVINLVKHPIRDLITFYSGRNRINNVGEALETYVKDLLCSSFTSQTIEEKIELYSKHLSYIGNANNPPDLIIRGGDSIEVKKIEKAKPKIALNSSYPKDKLHSDSSMLNIACRNCEGEKWSVKDHVYIIGQTPQNRLQALWIVYGDCYCASTETYERLRGIIASGVKDLTGVEFADTKELGRVNKVDPLGITDLRIRGMWQISHPAAVFGYLSAVQKHPNSFANVILQTSKYVEFPEETRHELEGLVGQGLIIHDIQVRSPNNPAQLLDAKLLQVMK